MNNHFNRAILIASLSFIVFAALPTFAFAQSAYWGQQMMRQQQMQAQMQRQAQQAQMRAQQQARQQQMRQQQQRQQQIARERQRQIQAQMQQRRQAAAMQRQRAAQKQRAIQLQRQQQIKSVQRPKVSGTSQRPVTAGAKATFQQRTLRQQRLAKDRAKRLEQLRLQRQKQDRGTASSQKNINSVVMLSSLASRSRSAGAAPKPIAKSALSLKQLRDVRVQQQSAQRMTKQLTDVRKSVQAKAKRALEIQRRTKLDQNRKNNGSTKPAEVKRILASARKSISKNCIGSSCKTCSFHSDTKVLTSHGPLPIRDLVADETMVLAKNEHNGNIAWKKVSAHYYNKYEWMVLLELEISDSEARQVIKSNRIHPYFVLSDYLHASASGITKQNGQWTEAKELVAGDRIASSNSSKYTVVDVIIKYEPFVAYNITVDEYSTYFVSGGASASSGVWVHNDCNQPVEDTKSATARQALRNAKVANGVPRSAQPDRTIKPNTEEGKQLGLDKRNVKMYVYTNTKGNKIYIRQDKPANYKDGGKGDQGPHFNAGTDPNKLKQHHYYQ